MTSFTDIGISEKLAAALSEMGIREPTEVQKRVIPVVAAGKNTVFQSETGTGKTFAYLLPLLMKIQDIPSPRKGPRLVIVAPTYELAAQIRNEAERTVKAAELPLKTALFIGTSPLGRQIEKLKERPDIIAGSPARLLELARLKKLKTTDINAAVFDEADRLLSAELRDVTCALAELFPPETQAVMCSATVGRQFMPLLKKHLRSGGSGREFDSVFLPPENVLTDRITHWAFYAEQRDKTDLLRSFLHAEKPAKALVFTSRTAQADLIASKLRYRKIVCAELHAKNEKADRKKALDDFRSGKCTVLITSDLAARGLDIDGVTHVIQMDMPSDGDFFIHRAGRTGRMGKKGINAVIGDARELRQLAALEKKLGITVYPKVLYGGTVAAPDVFS